MTDDPRPEHETPAEPPAETPEEPAPAPEPAAEVEPELAPEVAPEPGPEPGPEPVPVPVRSYRTVVGAGSAVYAVVVIALVLLVTVPLAPRLFGYTPTDRVLAGAAALAAAPEVHYTGAALAGTLRLDVRSEHDGTGVGTVTSFAGAKATLLTVSGTTYTKGDRNWWLDQKSVDTGIYAGHWMTEGQLHFEANYLLSPEKLAAAIRQDLTRETLLATAAKGHAVTSAGSDHATALRGTPVDAYRTPSKLTVYVTRDTPYRVVAVDGDMSALGGQQGSRFAIDLGLGTTADRTRLAGDVRTASKGLDADKDPAEPADYSPTAASGNQVGCSQSGCGESVEVQNIGKGAPKGQGYLLGRFTDESGKELGTCRAPIPALQPGASARVTCSISSPAWKAWAGAGGGSYRFDSYAFSPGWDGDDPSTIAKLLTYPALRNLDDVVATPVEAAKVLVTLLDTKGWTAEKAVGTVSELADEEAIGWLYDLLATGKYTADPQVLSDPDVDALALAAQRVRDGSSGATVGGYVAPDGTSYYGDVFDLGARQDIGVAEDTSEGSVSGLLLVVKRKADNFTVDVAPSGWSKRIHLALDTSDPLYRLDKAGLRAALKHEGLTAAQLHGADLDLVTAYGTVTLAPGDLR